MFCCLKVQCVKTDHLSNSYSNQIGQPTYLLQAIAAVNWIVSPEHRRSVGVYTANMRAFDMDWLGQLVR